MTKKNTGLGRGLSALLSDTQEAEVMVNESRAASSNVGMIPVDKVDVNPYQPRVDFNEEALQELADSIKVHGIIQPLTVRQLSRNEYQLIAGERRLQAAKRAGLTEVPAYIRTADDQQMLEMGLIENIQRENLNAIEIALSYQRLMAECNLKQEELGDRVGKKRSTVTNYMRLLKLPPEVQAGIRDSRISMGHARALIAIENIEHQLLIYHQIISQDLSVRKVEELVRDLEKPKTKSATEAAPVNPEIKRLQTQLSSHFGTKVNISADAKTKGEIKIPFNDTDDLNRILEILELV
jgi:ParB family transcriptional regulator, chromosome partitioning protein